MNLLNVIEHTVLTGRKISFARNLNQLEIQILDNDFELRDTSFLPLDDPHFEESKIASCITFQNLRLDEKCRS